MEISQTTGFGVSKLIASQASLSSDSVQFSPPYPSLHEAGQVLDMFNHCIMCPQPLVLENPARSCGLTTAQDNPTNCWSSWDSWLTLACALSNCFHDQFSSQGEVQHSGKLTLMLGHNETWLGKQIIAGSCGSLNSLGSHPRMNEYFM